eukprot:12080808-Alexandrium_andersonii.AAC.1
MVAPFSTGLHGLGPEGLRGPAPPSSAANGLLERLARAARAGVPRTRSLQIARPQGRARAERGVHRGGRRDVLEDVALLPECGPRLRKGSGSGARRCPEGGGRLLFIGRCQAQDGDLALLGLRGAPEDQTTRLGPGAQPGL